MSYKGDLKGFPKEIVNKLLDEQKKQGNQPNVLIFEDYKCRGGAGGGVTWSDTIDGKDFWYNVIVNKDFDLFFQRYPKKSSVFPRVVEVRDVGNIWVKRVAIAIQNGICIAWANAETIEESKSSKSVITWDLYREIGQEMSSITEVTLEEVAKMLGKPVDQIRIKK